MLKILEIKKCLRAKAEPEVGFEPTTSCLQDRCSSQMSYSGILKEYKFMLQDVI